MENQVQGIYIERKLYPKDSKHLLEWASTFNIRGLYTKDQLHLTVAYSRENISHTLDTESLTVEPIGLTTFGNSLVLLVYNNQLFERFFDIILEGATYDFPDYVPHITIAELPEDFDASNLVGKNFDYDIDLTEEVLSDLDLNWKETNNITASELLTYIHFDASCYESALPVFLSEFNKLSPERVNENTITVKAGIAMSSVIFVDKVKYYTDQIEANVFYVSAFPVPVS